MMRTEKPRATVGIPFRNPGGAFSAAIQSVFAQTVTDWELILCDDGSDDGSLERALGVHDPRVRVLHDGRSRGLSARLNEVIAQTSTDYFFRMDADDIMHPERLERQLQVLETSARNTVVGSAAFSIDPRGAIVGYRTTSGTASGIDVRKTFIHPTVGARTDWFRGHPYSEAPQYFRAEDGELWCRAAASSRFVVLDEPLLFYREGASSFSAYIGSETGVLHLLTERFRKPRGAYLRGLFVELAKIGVAATLESFGRFDLFVRRRYQPLTAEQRADAEAALARVLATEIPR